MDAARISVLLAPFLERPLAPAQLDQISMYINLLLRWNARINLTAVRDPESIVTRHFGESFFLARHLLPAPCDLDSVPALDRGPQTARIPRLAVVDIGSGAGFPALPLKLWAPQIALTLIESNHKKVAFLREASRSLTLTDVNVICARAETLPGRIPPADLVTFRAVENFENIVPLAIRLLTQAGRLAVLIGLAQFASLTSLASQLSWSSPSPIPNSESRVLAISLPGI